MKPLSAMCGLLVITCTIILSTPESMAGEPGVKSNGDWMGFRGPGGQGNAHGQGLPTEWNGDKNIVWRTELPGPGSSSPITVGKRIYLTCYSGYGLEPNKGDMDDLRRHVLCFDRSSGKILWDKKFTPALPESKYSGGNNSRHGYTTSTPATDGKHLYVFMGKSGVFCLDLDGKEVWHTDVGDRTTGWGSATSPVLYKNLVIVNASVESGSLVALDKKTGKEVWQAKGIGGSWNSPLLVEVKGGPTEVVVSASRKIMGFDAETGKELWHCKGFSRYVCPTAVSHDGVVYAIAHYEMVAVRAGGRGEVDRLWTAEYGCVVSSPVYHQGHLYWMRDGGTAFCLNAKDGSLVYEERPARRVGNIYASPIVADGKVYYVTQDSGTLVLPAEPKIKLLAHNKLGDDNSRTNGSPIVSNNQLLLRTDRYLYCIGK